MVNLEDKSNHPNQILKRIAALKDHYILCGAGDTGIFVAEEFQRRRAPLVVVEQSMQAIRHLQQKLGDSLLCLQGDATEDEVLQLAGIERAKGLVAALSEDKDNVFTILTARSLNPRLRIVTRVEDPENTEKLRQAGADVITEPNTTGGMRMASQLIRPEVVAFLDHMFHVSSQAEKLRLTEVPVDHIQTPDLTAAELTIADIGQHTEFLIIAIKREGKYIYRPRGSARLRRATETTPGDVLVVIATQAQLARVTGAGQS
jgi:voltage-gated potassium channel